MNRRRRRPEGLKPPGSRLGAERRARFVREYLVDLNATQAAIRAGYSKRRANVQGAQLLKRPDVAAAVRAGIEARNQRLQISADRVLQELAAIGFAKITDFVTWDKDGVKVIASKDLEACVAAAIAEISQEATSNGPRVKVKLSNKHEALVSLAKHLGLFRDEAPTPVPTGAQPATVNVYQYSIHLPDNRRQLVDGQVLEAETIPKPPAQANGHVATPPLELPDNHRDEAEES